VPQHCGMRYEEFVNGYGTTMGCVEVRREGRVYG
jgi:hypothetical protein